ncbi:Bifunctional folate synthesis protein [Mucilaginibacter gotjawali]|uniref:2-amino-4-hydroxy-6-hydroxymethyldihydropteridine pyrophosphokinase n=1 Tax=Mucilaginibacter gotjawali TaxID=1550579 RepID=A0A0X8X530_9SPHI|nr:2-amino-4-hydroxy-6-hydroxymethyldihydropteridine diphosphokinase [Mucilaginibacter gotjawali]BAU55233.1 Bifunctional folate synthesis protein [Mucilaginibacter gotjawali]
MHEVFLLLGSNLGDRQLFMKQAIDQIESVIAPVLKKSSVYETQSWGKTDAPDYLNQVILLKTAFNPNEVLEKVLNIENRLGRRREEKWGSRTIDIDILLYDQQIINDPGLIIPHPELQKRRFTLEPLAEIAADTMHPVLKKIFYNLNSNLLMN